MTIDFIITLQWWVTIFLVGIITLPLTGVLFNHFIDKGYAFSKSLGILLVSYLMLLFGTLHILPFSFASLFLIAALILTGEIFLSQKYPKKIISIPRILKTQWRWIVVEEILFIVILFIWAFIRSYSPEINGLEKFMDYGFVNSILRSDFFPPKDMWLTPFSINYYYFGHFITAVLTKLSLLKSEYTYNLMIATLAGLTFVGSFSLAANLYNQFIQKKYLFKIIVAGILTACIVTFSGNLHTLYTFFKPYENDHPIPMWSLAFSPSSFPNSYWYPNATRFIHNTIHEFPMYSWTVSDLHGHVTDIPFVLLTLAYIFSLLISSKKQNPTKKLSISLFKKKITVHFSQSIPLITLGFFLACMYMTNAWDGLIYFLLAIMLLAYQQYESLTNKKILLSSIISVSAKVFPLIIFLAGCFVIFSLPFSLFFKPFVSGIGILCAPNFLVTKGQIGPFLFETDHCQKSPLWQLFVLYGFFYFFAISLMVTLKKITKRYASDIFIFMIFALSTILIIIPEFMYAKDIYPAHYRANTMFKLVFQAFIMLSLVSGYSISRIMHFLKTQTSKSAKIAYMLFFTTTLLLLSLVFVYPYYAVSSYYGNFNNHQGLNGVRYLSDRYPDDAKAIAWMKEHISGQPVILEAQGDSYTDYARVSTNTGLPTILGWTVHEWLWRGTYDVPAPRIEEIKQMYESKDIKKTLVLLKKYKVQYVFIGNLEHEKYTVNEAVFKTLGKVVYQSGATIIYRMSI
ncbi:MAG: hypothetical protein HZC02_03195 [Candidatus Levybacteria bacterium]|nr:hypothetical protein [Candidatus Levybacteria bacterium]